MADTIEGWLRKNRLEKFIEAFLENEISLDVLDDLTEQDLKSLGMPMGPRKRFLRAVGESPGSTEVDASFPLSRETSATETGERRHLTVMFCDLIGSTALSERLDPEDFREAIRVFRDACARSIQDYDGFIARYMGDGILVYFGYPQAHEDDAERAVRASLSIAASLEGLAAPDGTGMEMRVGIASGVVVAGDVIGEGASEERSVLGDSPNLAARLQSLAPSNGIVISESTHRLIEGLFVCQDMGPQELKGISEPVSAYQVSGESDVNSRFEAISRRGLTPLVGRIEEINLLLKRWEQSKDGDGQVVLLSGEAGVGKSRLMSAFQDHLSSEHHGKAYCFCSPFRQNTALYPIIGYFERILRFATEEDSAAKLDKIEAFLSDLDLSKETFAPILATVLEMPVEERYGPIELSPQQLRDRTLDVVTSILEAQAAKNPTLIVLEDIHWVDPTTLELCERIIKRLRGMRALFVIAHRPEFEPPWKGLPNITSYSLNHLGRRECAELVTKVTSGKDLPEDVIAQIVKRTDGVPLFVEEMTKTLIESDILEDAGDRYELLKPLSSVAIPESLMDSLMARLDRLGEAKDIAQVGSVIGRSFSYELLSVVTSLDDALLEASLDKLIESGLVFQRGIAPKATYEFQHALIQDAAYKGLLRSRRQQLHALIAETLQQRFPDQGEHEPEVLAHHFTMAGLVEQGVEYWHRAGQKESDHSAYHEAIALCERGLSILESMPDENLRSKWELELQLVIGLSAMAVHGFSSPKVNAAYSRAHDLAKQLDESAKLFTASWGMWIHRQQTGQIDSARKTADELLQLADQLGDVEFLLEAHHAAWATCFRMGDFKQSRYHAEQGIALHNPEEHFQLANRYAGHDAGICARNHAALSSWFMGHPDQAVEHNQACVSLIDQIKHPLSKVHGKCFGAILYRHLGDAEHVRLFSEGSLELSRELGYPQYREYAEVLRGWAVAQVQDKDEGIAIMNRAIDDLTDIGAWARCGTFLPCLTDIHVKNDETDKALETVERALELFHKSGERTAETEILLLKGEALERSGAPREDVEGALQDALELASKDGVRAMELRAATALARVWRDAGRRDEALALLKPIYSAFSEGLNTPDLVASRTVLEDLEVGP